MTRSKDNLRLWLQLMKVTRDVENDLRDMLRRDHQTTLARFDVMAALYKYPTGLKMSELSTLLMVSNGNVTGLIDRMCGDDLVKRFAVKGDRRASRVKLTDKGKQDFESQASDHEEWIAGRFSKITDDQLPELHAALQLLRKEAM